jgi:integral membrane sensor domain MASE1
MDALLAAFAPYGFAAVVCAVLFWMVIRLQDKNAALTQVLFNVVEQNTKAFAELKGVIEKCQFTHDRHA